MMINCSKQINCRCVINARRSIKREGELFFAMKSNIEYSFTANTTKYSELGICISSVLQLTKDIMASNSKIFSICGQVATVQIEENEATISMFDNSGYACINFKNIDSDFKGKVSPGDFRIDGIFTFKKMVIDQETSISSEDLMEMIVATVDYRNCRIVSTSSEVIKKFNDTLNLIPPSYFSYPINFSKPCDRK